MGKVLRFILLLPFIPLIYAFSYQALLYLQEVQFKDVVFFLLGLAVYLLLYVMFWNKRIGFLETLEHELTHAAAALTILQMPKKLVVDPKLGGGKGGVTETVGCFWVALAPYFLPTFTLPILLIRPIVPPPFDNIVNFMIGFTLSFHYVRLIKDLLVKQTDITKTGTIFSAVTLIFLNLVFLVGILAVVAGDYSSIPMYITASFERTKTAYEATYAAIKSQDLPTLDALRVWGK
jgi:hypothetical protein